MTAMPAILQLTRKLHQRPALPALPEFHLRHYQGPHDVSLWLELRRRAFARQKLGVRDWQEEDFAREFLEKSWWQPRSMWFAETQPLLMPVMPVGSVTLARRGEDNDAKAVVHWLFVLPSYRRRAVGRLLIAALEAAAWDAGDRQIWLETHSQWTEAARMYEKLGYEPVEPSAS